MIKNNNFGRWDKIEKMNLEQTVDIVFKGKTVSNADASMGALKFIGDIDQPLKILDFGSGVGRNAFPMSDYSSKWHIDCYDNIQMHHKAEQFLKERYNKQMSDYDRIKFLTNWQKVKENKYDCIVAILVFQHIIEPELVDYLNDIKKMTRKLVVAGRRCLDGFDIPNQKRSVWDILEENGFIPTYCNNQEKYNNKDGDPDDHFICVYDIHMQNVETI